MARFVLVCDSTLVNDYRNFPLLDFLPCAPANIVPKSIYSFLKGPPVPAMANGETLFAPYSIRKLEAILQQRFNASDIAVPHESNIEKFITEDTEIIAVSTMDPLGIGPLTMSYAVLFGSANYVAWVRREWEALIEKVNRARKGKKAKLIVGGPGVWEFTLMPEELDRENIDYAFQGESDDVLCDLFEQLPSGNLDASKFYRGYLSYDDNFHTAYKEHQKFICRSPSSKRIFPLLEEIPLIKRPAMKGLIEIMRGCGIGCDFCEVTLRPLRYYSPEMVAKEIEVNVNNGNGHSNAWLHTDEFFAYKHGRFYQPNEEALTELLKAAMKVKGVTRVNPTHGRISIPAAYPEMIERLSKVMNAGPRNWIGVQVGLETGSSRLAMMHMPNKTLPLRIGPDGDWQEIVWNGVRNFTKYYWRPAFTIQVGQRDETDEDNWESIALINRLSISEVDGHPFEFTVTPMYNMPLGKIKTKNFNGETLNSTQMGVYYASYRHLAKMTSRNAARDSLGNPLVKAGTAGIISMGGWGMMKMVERLAKKRGVDVEKVKNYGIENGNTIKARTYAITSVQQIMK